MAYQWDIVGFPGAHITTAYFPNRNIQTWKDKCSEAIGAIQYTELDTQAHIADAKLECTDANALG